MAKGLRIAIGEQLRQCPGVITLGVRPQLSDYTGEERRLLLAADRIFYPTVRFVDIFAGAGKETFPSASCYRFLGDKLKQTALFRLLKVPHPRTRVYYGQKQKERIAVDFSFPFVGKRAFRSSRGRHVFLIRDPGELSWYNQHFNPAYVQEYLPGGRELRVIVLNYRVVWGSWRVPAPGDFRCTVPFGPILPEETLPAEPLSLAKEIARSGKFSDVAVDMLFDGKRFWVLELNFRYGSKGWPGHIQDRLRVIGAMIERGEL
jgi:ribosomal protein S6--L-glutamate ligase